MNFITAYIGKLLFPRLPRDLRRRKINIISLVLFISLLAACAIAFAMVMVQRMDRQ
jgi:hypothetical protein